MDSIKVKLAAKLDIDKETEQKINNFTKALDELPSYLNINVVIDGKETDTRLIFNFADILIDQVKRHFSKN